jgi:hypothetical protein
VQVDHFDRDYGDLTLSSNQLYSTSLTCMCLHALLAGLTDINCKVHTPSISGIFFVQTRGNEPKGNQRGTNGI